MGLYMEQKLIKEISRALKVYSEAHLGEVAYKEIVDLSDIFRGTQRPGLVIKAEDGTTYQIKVEHNSLY
ncbi:hypothetical protein [Litchfieldia salsa]|uniref:Uncharacterized protein n=1 Tax=Litchfieldia salsa TaxID=930152 RepID=A0A1H0TAB0_9BACI|nr:hypothetical protein [Litchfieldia salsa]SDP50741.1 hypothetical protein SAMN05216565_103367 [Litchfieldia salsa]